MVDCKLIEKSEYNNDSIKKLLEINEYLTKPAIINQDNNNYIVDYQYSDGYKTYAILNKDKLYGIAYEGNALSLFKDNNTYRLNQEKLLQKYDKYNLLEEEINYYQENDYKCIVYSKLLDNGYSVVLRYLANYSDYNILLNYLYDHIKRPDLIIITKSYFRIGLLDFYKKKSLDLVNDSYITRGKYKIEYTKEEIDQLLNKLNLPNYIPKELLNTYLDKDNTIKTLKRVINTYEDNYVK